MPRVADPRASTAQTASGVDQRAVTFAIPHITLPARQCWLLRIRGVTADGVAPSSTPADAYLRLMAADVDTFAALAHQDADGLSHLDFFAVGHTGQFPHCHRPNVIQQLVDPFRLSPARYWANLHCFHLLQPAA